MENNYWIVNDWLIFKPEFNEPSDDYYDIINQRGYVPRNQ